MYAAYEQRTLQKGFEKFNPTAAKQQVAELEAEQARRRTKTGSATMERLAVVVEELPAWVV